MKSAKPLLAVEIIKFRVQDILRDLESQLELAEFVINRLPFGSERAELTSQQEELKRLLSESRPLVTQEMETSYDLVHRIEIP